MFLFSIAYLFLCFLPKHDDFYTRVQDLKSLIEKKRGHPMRMKVIEFGEDLYWADIGQVEKARQAKNEVAVEGPAAEFSRKRPGVLIQISIGP